MSYETYLRKALEIARSIQYERIYGSIGGDRGTTDGGAGASNWILATGFWRDKTAERSKDLEPPPTIPNEWGDY